MHKKRSAIKLLKLLATEKENGKEITPLPGKTWSECYVYEYGFMMLNYHTPDSYSSKMVCIEVHHERIKHKKECLK